MPSSTFYAVIRLGPLQPQKFHMAKVAGARSWKWNLGPSGKAGQE